MQQIPDATARLSFRNLQIDDSKLFHQWLSDYEVIKYSQGKFLKSYTIEQVKNWLDGLINSKTSANFAIILLSAGELIGYAGIASISKTNNSGEYFILIGDKSKWNQGLGQEATWAVTDYGFDVLKLHRIQLTVSNLNSAGVVAYKKAGYVEEGVMRDASFRDGKYHDKILMSIIR